MKRLLAVTLLLCAAGVAAAQTTPVLIPILYNGAGRYGSRWQTTIGVNNFTSQTIEGHGVTFLSLACPIPEGCPAPHLLPDWAGFVTGPESPSGLLLHVPAAEADGVEIDARFGEETRDRFGVELPIARERDFRTDGIVIPRVLIYWGAPSRTTLRIYSPEPEPIQVRIEFYTWHWRGEPRASRVVTLAAGDAIHPAFAQFDLQRDFADVINGTERIRIVPLPYGDRQPRIWAFATITDNATNAVSVFSPAQ